MFRRAHRHPRCFSRNTPGTVLLTAAVLLAGPSACTTRGWYEGFETARIQQCEQELRACPERQTYERYQRETVRGD
ncbi:MAG: hypothetical protein ACPGU7_04600 [Gammaproteobacteria bacterium]